MNYDSKWRDLRQRSRFFWFVFLVWAPASAVISTVLDAISPRLGSRHFLWITGPWMIAYLAAGVWLMRFRCPQCRELFFSRLELERL
jgi:hypothetical protein